LGDLKKALGVILLILISVQLAFAWSDGIYIKSDANKIYSLDTIPQYRESIKVDANGDGDISDEGDYILYNELYIRDGENDALVRLVYSVDPPSPITPNVEDFPGAVVEIKGKRYLITQASGGAVTMGESIEIKLLKHEKFDIAKAKTVVGDVKFRVTDSTLSSDKMGTLNIVVGDSVAGEINLDSDYTSGAFPNRTDITSYVAEVTDALEGYRIYLTDAKLRSPTISLVKDDELFEIRNGQKDVFGYEEVRINDDEFGSGSNRGAGKIKLLSRLYTIAAGGEEKVEGSDSYRLQTNDKNRIRIARYVFPITNETVKAALENASARISAEWRGESIKTYENKILVLDDYGPEFIEVDANEDGDVRDEEDYVLYNQLYVLTGTPTAEIRLIYNVEPPKVSALLKGPFGNLLGMTVEINGIKYLVTLAEENKITIGEGPIEKALRKLESPDPASAVNFVGDIGMLRAEEPGRSLGNLYIYEGSALLGTIELSAERRDITSQVSEITDALADYTVILSNTSSIDAKVAIVKTDKLTTITDEASDVFGYEKVYVNNDEFPQGRDRVKFLSKLYTIEKDNETEVVDAPVYTLQYNKYGEFKVKRGRFLKKEEPKNETNETIPGETLAPGETGAPIETPPPIIAGTGGSLLELVKAEQESYNQFMETAEIPGVLRGFASGRYIVHVDDDTIGIVLEGGFITEVRDGGIEDPNTEIWTSWDYLEKIYASDGALGLVVAGLANGEIEKKDYGVGGKLKGRAGLAGLRLSEVFSPTKITLSEEGAEGSVKDLTKSVVEGTYAMNPATSDLRRTHIEMKSPEGEDVGGEEIKVKEYAGYKPGKAPKGLKKWEEVEGETSLGTFVDIEKEVDVEEALIFIKYSKEELEKLGFDEGQLYIKWYDDNPDSDTYGRWITITEGNPSWVISIALDKENEGVWVRTKHFSVYGIGGSVYGVSGSVYGVSGNVIGPPPEPLPVVEVETTVPIEPIKEVEQPGFIKRIYLLVKAIILGR
jgi:hypothetical protein